VVKLIKVKKKECYENIDLNKGNSIIMWETLKEVIRGESSGNRGVEDINFESLNNAIKHNIHLDSPPRNALRESSRSRARTLVRNKDRDETKIINFRSDFLQKESVHFD